MSDQSFLGVSTTTTDASHDHGPTTPSTPTSPLMKPTRTVAIIKPHAVDHRFEIEHRITEAKFERDRWSFDMETDPDALFELFGDDARSFAEGPVWYMSSNAAVPSKYGTRSWATLTPTTLANSPRPPSVPSTASPGSTTPSWAPPTPTPQRSRSTRSSSPPRPSPPPTSPLPTDPPTPTLASSPPPPSDPSRPPSAPPHASRNNAARAAPTATPPPAPRPRTPAPHALQSARHNPVPRLPDHRPAHDPRGLPPRRAPRTPPSKEALRKIFADVPGHKRTASIQVASTAAPTVPPRMTRAAALRISGATPPTPVVPKPIITIAQAKAKAAEEERAKAALQEAQARTFEGVPGHKRRESISVSSTAKAPTITPRQNRSALLRASKDATPPSSYQFRPPIGPSLSRSTSSDSYGSPGRPSTAQGDVNSPRRSFSRMSDIGPGAIGTPPRERPHQLAGADDGAAAKPQRDATSSQNSQRSLRDGRSYAERFPLCVCIPNAIRSSRLFLAHLGAGAASSPISVS
ncbi:hypothetical protein F5148DRAFT_1379175 [Russula earlei]|uniref:Uncharacterized protein n=1 Tax=Russula earlei TaxID=71964 RepID=A0ACC0TUR7_9AGAM|nr:hypothetical protein F5148DRAFT_1379175 [Russula earlei]